MSTSVVFAVIGVTTFAALLAFMAWAAALLVEIRSLRRALLRRHASSRRARSRHGEGPRVTRLGGRPTVELPPSPEDLDEGDDDVTRVARRPPLVGLRWEPRRQADRETPDLGPDLGEQPSRERPTILPPPSR